MCASRLDEIRNKLREQINLETGKSAATHNGPALDDRSGSARDSIRSQRSQAVGAATGRSASATPAQRDTENAGHKVSPRSECKALCIGMNKYTLLNPLENATRDAQDMASAMNHLGYEVTSIFDRDSISTKNYLDRFLASIEAGDDVVLTFAGHGASFNSEPHLFPIDAAHPHEAINLYSEFIDRLKYTQAKSAIIIIDACRNQERLNVEDTLSTGNPTDEEDWEMLEEWFDQLNNPSSQAHAKHRGLAKSADSSFGHGIIFATSHDTGASDGTGGIENGLFTHFFKNEILNPQLSLTEIFNNVRREVMENSDGRQRPSFHDELSEGYYFYPR